MTSYYNNVDCIPDLSGKWNTLGTIFKRKTPSDVPNFDTIETVLFSQEITQKDNFLIIKEKDRYRLGVLNFMYGEWSLTIADDDDDGIMRLTPKNCGNYSHWTGNYAEPGFDNRTQQSQTVAKVEMLRENEHCNCVEMLRENEHCNS